MKNVLISAMVFVAVLEASPSFSQAVAPTLGSGGSFQQLCEAPAGADNLCIAYLFGYTQAMEDATREVNKANGAFNEQCSAGNKKMCTASPGIILDIDYNGCNSQAGNLSLDVVRHIILDSLKQHPERSKWDFGSVYRAAIADAFVCKHE